MDKLYNSDQQISQCDEIIRAIKGVRFGSVEVIIHDSKVVQIERREKVRLDKDHSVKGR